MGWEQQLMLLGLLVFGWGLSRAYASVRRRHDRLRRMLFHASFAAAAPAVWLAADTAGPGATAAALALLVTPVPTVRSAIIFHRRGTGKAAVPEAERWLSYWACWPTVRWVHYIFSAQTENTGTLHRVLLIAILWLQFWSGSQHFTAFASAIWAYIGKPFLGALRGAHGRGAERRLRRSPQSPPCCAQWCCRRPRGRRLCGGGARRRRWWSAPSETSWRGA